jgi:hypothetical protein
VLPVTIWAGDVGAAVREVPEGTPLTVVERLSARGWNGRLDLELVSEGVTVDVTALPGEAAAPAERPVPRAAARRRPRTCPSRPGGAAGRYPPCHDASPGPKSRLRASARLWEALTRRQVMQLIQEVFPDPGDARKRIGSVMQGIPPKRSLGCTRRGPCSTGITL